MNQDIMQNIKSSIHSMSKSQKRIAQLILEHPDMAAYLTATKLGNRAEVSESTVVRFAIELGYKGYPEMQKALKNQIKTNMTSVQRVNAAHNIMSGNDVLEKIMTLDIEKIKLTLDEVDKDMFSSAVQMISDAKRVYIIGVRSSSMLANFLAYYLNIATENVTLLNTTSSSEMFEKIMRISEEDVLVGISFPRYSKRTRNAIEFAKKRGTKILAITDCDSSPISRTADCTLFAKSDMASFVDSLVAPLSIINALIVGVSLNKKEQLSGNLSELEKIWDEYEVYDKTN